MRPRTTTGEALIIDGALTPVRRCLNATPMSCKDFQGEPGWVIRG